MDARYPGKGILTWSDGRRYQGNFKEDKMEGQGILTWSDGRRYEGEFLEDEMSAI